MKFFNFLTLSLGLLLFSCQEEQSVFDKQPSVAISEISSVSSTEVNIKFSPNDLTSKYSYALGHATDLDSFLGGKLETIKEGRGEQVINFKNLNQASEYTIFVLAFDKIGRSSAVSTKVFTPDGRIPSVNLVFVGSTQAGLDITTNPYVYRVVYGIDKAGLKDNFETTMKTDTITDIYYKYVSALELTEGTKYSFYVKSFDRYNNESEISEMSFTTATKEEASSVKFDIIESDPFQLKYKVTPSNNTSKFLILGGEKGIHDYILESKGWAGNAFSMMLSWWDLESGSDPLETEVEMHYGEKELIYQTHLLEPKQEMDYYILSYDLNENPYAVEKIQFSTELAISTGTPDAEIEEIEITKDGCKFKITPNEHTLGVLYSTFSKTNYDTNWAGEDKLENLRNYMHQQMISALANKSEVPWTYGSAPFDYLEIAIQPGTDYYVVAIPIGKSGVTSYGSTKLLPFKTLPAPPVDPDPAN